MIEIVHLTKAFNDQIVLKDINFEIKNGEILTVLGESGSGKSVLLRHMIGLLKPNQGSIKIDGVEISSLSEKELLNVRKNIGFLFQEGALYDFMTVFENVAFPLQEHTDLKAEEIFQKVSHVLKEVDLEVVEEKFPSELSGGMKKRVALARAIVLDSRVIFCDEPTSGLDPIRSRDISDLICRVARHRGCTAVVTSHDIENSLRISDRLALIREGEIVALGSPLELKNIKDPWIRQFIG